MAITTPVLNGVTLPQVSVRDGYMEYPGYRGVDTEMVSGALATDLVSTAVKRRFELSWVGLTETQVTHSTTGLLKAWEGVRGGSASFTAPTGGSYTVTRDIGEMELQVTWYRAAGGLRADVRMKLREV